MSSTEYLIVMIIFKQHIIGDDMKYCKLELSLRVLCIDNRESR